MTDLTEQWKKGQLKGFRWYYVKFKTGEIDSCFLTEWSDELGTGGQYFEGIEEENILEVLAPVPSYEEWQAKLEENTKLKELLKKHRDIFARTLALCIDLNFSEKQKNQFADDIAEIDRALGEDKCTPL